MKLEEAVQNAARYLPDCWQINLGVERGAGWVVLLNEDDDAVEFDTSPDKDLAEQIDDAIDHARKRCGLPPASKGDSREG